MASLARAAAGGRSGWRWWRLPRCPRAAFRTLNPACVGPQLTVRRSAEHDDAPRGGAAGGVVRRATGTRGGRPGRAAARRARAPRDRPRPGSPGWRWSGAASGPLLRPGTLGRRRRRGQVARSCPLGPARPRSARRPLGPVLSHPRRTVVPCARPPTSGPPRGASRVVSDFEPSGDQPAAIDAAGRAGQRGGEATSSCSAPPAPASRRRRPG